MSRLFAGEKTPAKASFLLTLKEDQQGRKSCIENLLRIQVRIQMRITAYLLEYQREVNNNIRNLTHY